MSNLANVFTGLNLACGFTSLIFCLESHWTFSALAIIFSVIFDGIDGFIARQISASTEFGKELDSLVDVVCFGVAPSLLGYVFVYQQFNLLASLVLFVYLLCSILRLARYNIVTKEKNENYFTGLPTTASAAFLASFILMYRKYVHIPNPVVFFLLVLLLSLLMISRIKYINLYGLIGLIKPKALIFLSAVILLGLFTMPQLTLFIIFAAYLTTAPLLRYTGKV